jgi:prefoldin subunit 5
MRKNLLATSTLCLATALAACGGGNAEDPKTPAAKASIELTPMEELKAIPADLNAEVASLTKPIDDVQSIVDELGALPKKHGLTAADVMGLAKGTFENGKVEVSLKGDVSAAAKADVEATLKKLSATVTALKATPEKVTSLTTKVAAATAKVPVLASKVTASATATVSNPFGNADAKAKAKAEMDSVQKVQADVTKSVSDIQGKLTGIPAMATTALAKLTASFAAGT